MIVSAFFLVIVLATTRDWLPWILTWISHASLSSKTRDRRIFLCKTPILEFFTFRSGLGSVFFFSEELWLQMNEDERTACLTWGQVASHKSAFWLRLFYPPKIYTYDRDCLLQDISPETLLTVFQKIHNHRLVRTPSLLGILFTGQSLIGPSIFKSWPSLNERESHVRGYLAQFSNTR